MSGADDRDARTGQGAGDAQAQSAESGQTARPGQAPDPIAAPVWRRAEIDSPCVQICVVSRDTGHCVGCGRTIDEIAQWSQMTAEARATICAELPARLAVRPSRSEGPSARRRARRSAARAESAPSGDDA